MSNDLGTVKLPAGTGPLTLTHGGDASTTHTLQPGKGSVYTPKDDRDLAALLAIDGAQHRGVDSPDDSTAPAVSPTATS